MDSKGREVNLSEVGESYLLRCCHGVVVVRPGDDLIITTDLDGGDIENFAVNIRSLLPGVNVVVINGNVQLAARRSANADA